MPRYISTVDSGNFVGYLYTLKQFLVQIKETKKSNINVEINNYLFEKENKQIVEQENKQMIEQDSKQIAEQENKQMVEQDSKQIVKQESKQIANKSKEQLKKEKIEQSVNENTIQELINIINNLIEKTDFSKLYDYEKRLFSIGFNIEENKLTDSYYDLLASEARQASLVAIAKHDIPSKHWQNLSRTLTTMNGYKRTCILVWNSI